MLSLGSASTGVTPQAGTLVNSVPLSNMPQSTLSRSSFGLRAVPFVVTVPTESTMTVRVGRVEYVQWLVPLDEGGRGVECFVVNK